MNEGKKKRISGINILGGLGVGIIVLAILSHFTGQYVSTPESMMPGIGEEAHVNSGGDFVNKETGEPIKFVPVAATKEALTEFDGSMSIGDNYQEFPQKFELYGQH